MSKSNAYTWSAIGLFALLACSTKAEDFGGSGSSHSGTNLGGKSGGSGHANAGVSSIGGSGNTNTGNNGTGNNGTGSTGNGTGSTGNGTGSTGNGTGSTGNGTGSTGNGTGNNGTGSTASTAGGAGSTVPAGGGSDTYDPPPPKGGNGNTEDPPPAKGGSGNTEDPPRGGSGNTEDPPRGGSGNTQDPPKGGSGNTQDPPPGCIMTEIDKVNVIVFKDAEPSGADSEGKMWVGGNATFSAGYAVASAEASIANCSDYGLVVGGDLTVAGGGKVVGKAAYGGELIRMPGSSLTFTCDVFHETPVDFASVESKLKGYSAAFKAYPANGVVTPSTSALTLTGTSTTLNVFNVAASQLNVEIRLNVPESSSVIVNVSGTAVTWQAIGFRMPDGSSCRGGTSDWCHRVLWNMYEAKSLYLSSIGVQGSVLAPYAAVDGGGGNIDGQLVCESLKGGIEYHPYFFTGCLLLPKA